jgi:hypothetical protein
MGLFPPPPPLRFNVSSTSWEQSEPLPLQFRVVANLPGRGLVSLTEFGWSAQHVGLLLPLALASDGGLVTIGVVASNGGCEVLSSSVAVHVMAPSLTALSNQFSSTASTNTSTNTTGPGEPCCEDMVCRPQPCFATRMFAVCVREEGGPSRGEACPAKVLEGENHAQACGTL